MNDAITVVGLDQRAQYTSQLTPHREAKEGPEETAKSSWRARPHHALAHRALRFLHSFFWRR
jgi:hypothetical protein